MIWPSLQGNSLQAVIVWAQQLSQVLATKGEPEERRAGEMMLWGGPTPPTGWLLCDGRVFEKAALPALAQAIGTTNNTGGETGTQFRLPAMAAWGHQGIWVIRK